MRKLILIIMMILGTIAFMLQGIPGLMAVILVGGFLILLPQIFVFILGFINFIFTLVFGIGLLIIVPVIILYIILVICF